MATTSKRYGLTNEEILKLLQSLDSDSSFDLSDNESVEEYKPQASEILTESGSSLDNDDKKSTETTTKKSKSGVKWSL